MTPEEQQAIIEQMRARQQPAAGPAAATAGAAALTPTAGAAKPGFDAEDPATWGEPGRNDPCPCGSGKKFKHCHGAL